jgi:hypothetical protein
MYFYSPEDKPWEPPDELLQLLKDTSIRQHTRVELIVAFYAYDHGGNAPPFQLIADIMDISKGNAYRYAMTLAARGSAISRHGDFWLVDSKYTHPLVKKRFKRILRKLPTP